MALKEIVSEVYDIFTGWVGGVDLLQEGFIYGNLKHLEEAGAAFGGMRGAVAALGGELAREKGGSPLAGTYSSLPSHMESIAGDLDKIASTVGRKVAEDLLFSDKAVNEVNFLFEKTRDILVNTRDMVLARNTIIGSYLVEAEHALVVLANDFSTRHEERLIEGLCLPRASAVYLDLLDAFKGIAWHAKEIARALMEK